MQSSVNYSHLTDLLLTRNDENNTKTEKITSSVQQSETSCKKTPAKLTSRDKTQQTNQVNK